MRRETQHMLLLLLGVALLRMAAGEEYLRYVRPAHRCCSSWVWRWSGSRPSRSCATCVARGRRPVTPMGSGDACPVFPGKRYLDWELTDPASKTVEQIRPIRDDIDTRACAPLDELVPPST